MIYIFLWFGFMVIGLYGSIGVSFRVEQAFGPQAGLLSGILTLIVCWGLAFYNMHLGFKEDIK